MLHLLYTDHCLFAQGDCAISICLVGWNVQRSGHLHLLCADSLQISTSSKPSIFRCWFRRWWQRWRWSVCVKKLILYQRKNIFHFIYLDYRLTESGLTQGLHNTKVKNRTLVQSASTVISLPLSTTTKTNMDDDDGDDEERENLITNRESSHEYD